jgi:hypothetical protein
LNAVLLQFDTERPARPVHARDAAVSSGTLK